MNRLVIFVGICLILNGCKYRVSSIEGMEQAVSIIGDAALQIGSMKCLDEVEISFDKLPPGCKEVYNQELLELRKATTTNVIRYDIDRDGKKEIIVWDGNPGTGGGGWYVFVWDGKAWRSAGSMSGSPCGRADGKPGIFSSWACGWDSATVTYFELEDFKLIRKASFDVEYAEPIKIVISK